jgi:16S rRNA (guanine527-N7)-methyltransferase
MGAVASETAPRAESGEPRTRSTRPEPLLTLSATAGIDLDERAAARFDVYRDLLVAWNARFNLTAIVEPAEIDRRLFLDTLMLLPAMDAAVAETSSPRLIDIGSGAGFPGLALKVARPAWQVTLVEATGKKVDFLRACIGELGLRGVAAHHGRAEDLGRDPAYRERFDLATARAVASLPTLLELCAPFLRLGGRAYFPKGLNLAEEFEAGRRAAPLVGVRLVGAEVLPGDQTTLVVAEKVGQTPWRFPRRSGIPTKEPLGAAPADRDAARGSIRRRLAPPDQGSTSAERSERLVL